MAETSVDAITSQAAKLSWLKSKVNLEVVSTSSNTSKCLLIGKILSNKSFPRALVKDILTKAWNVLNEIEVASVDKNVFVFTFKHEVGQFLLWVWSTGS